MVERPLAPGRGRAGEIERAEPPRRDRRSYHLHDVRIGRARARARSRRRACRWRRPRSASGPSAAAIAAGRNRRKVALHVDHHVVAPVRDRACRSPRKCGRSRRDGRAASSPPRRPNRSSAAAISAESAATATGPMTGGKRPLHDARDHRPPADVGERLVRQARGGEARRDDDDRVHGRFGGGEGAFGGKRSQERRLIRLAGLWQTAIPLAANSAEKPAESRQFNRGSAGSRIAWIPLSGTRLPEQCSSRSSSASGFPSFPTSCSRPRLRKTPGYVIAVATEEGGARRG